ncbi:MAG: HIT family protein [Stackebrandtia sp.]
MTCVFCSIIDGRLASSAVHEDAVSLAFMDLSPVTPGHTLVVPKLHYENLMDLPEIIGSHLWTVAHRIGQALHRSSLSCEGVSITMASGAAAGQEVFHAHTHVFPRYPGDSYRVHAEWARPGRTELDSAAEQVRAALTTGPAD